MVRQEPGDLVAVLLRQHRAGDVDEPAAGLDSGRRGRQQRALLGLALRQIGGLAAATWRRAAAARRPCRCRGRRRTPGRIAAPSAAERRLRRRPAAPGRCARRPASAARRSGAGAARRRRRRRSGRCCAWRRRRPASCRRRLHRYRAPAARGPAPAISAAICEPSSCTSYQPLPWPVSASTLGLPAGAFRGRQAHADRRVAGRLGGEAGQRLQHLLAVGLERVDAQVDRRPPRQRRAFLGGRRAEGALRRRAPANPGCRRARRPAHRRAAARDSAACSASLSGSSA